MPPFTRLTLPLALFALLSLSACATAYSKPDITLRDVHLARLGLIAAEGADPAAVLTPPAISATIAPEPALAASYDEAYRRYRALYPALQGVRP